MLGKFDLSNQDEIHVFLVEAIRRKNMKLTKFFLGIYDRHNLDGLLFAASCYNNLKAAQLLVTSYGVFPDWEDVSESIGRSLCSYYVDDLGFDVHSEEDSLLMWACHRRDSALIEKVLKLAEDFAPEVIKRAKRSLRGFPEIWRPLADYEKRHKKIKR